MPFIDILIIGLTVVFCIFGMLFGFGKGLKFFTSGILGIIISVFVCYALGGVILKASFVQNWLLNFREMLARKDNAFCDILNAIHLEVVLYYVILFIVVTIIRIIIVKLIKSFVEIENIALIAINKILGIVLFVGAFLMILLLVFWIISLIGGGTSSSFGNTVSQSKIGLKWLYENNPFMEIIKFIKIKITVKA